MAREESRKNGVQEERGLTVEVFGVSMLLSDGQVVLPDGRKARIASDRQSVIPPHIAFVAVEPNAYEREEFEPAFSFTYDALGDGTMKVFDAFMLDQNVVTFEGVDRNEPLVSSGNIPAMASLVGNIELCPGVYDNSLNRVIGVIDLTRARTIDGRDHGHHTHAIAFGRETRNWAEKISARFDADKAPRICFKPTLARQDEGRNAPTFISAQPMDRTIPLKGKGPWYVMVANVPPEELMRLNAQPMGQNVPLSHLELLYDFYHLSHGAIVPTPTCASHEVPHGAHDAHARIAGSEAHCGPPVTG